MPLTAVSVCEAIRSLFRSVVGEHNTETGCKPSAITFCGLCGPPMASMDALAQGLVTATVR